MTRFANLAIATALVAGWPTAWADDLAVSVVGTWRMIACRVMNSDGSVRDLYGPSPLGLLMYDTRGNMSVHLLKPDLPKCGTQDRRKCPDAQARLAFDNYGGYWGRYEVRSAEKVVFHHVQGASTPDWIGTSQKRFVELTGKRLTITTPPQSVAGVESVVEVVWERVD